VKRDVEVHQPRSGGAGKVLGAAQTSERLEHHVGQRAVRERREPSRRLESVGIGQPCGAGAPSARPARRGGRRRPAPSHGRAGACLPARPRPRRTQADSPPAPARLEWDGLDDVRRRLRPALAALRQVQREVRESASSIPIPGESERAEILERRESEAAVRRSGALDQLDAGYLAQRRPEMPSRPGRGGFQVLDAHELPNSWPGKAESGRSREPRPLGLCCRPMASSRARCRQCQSHLCRSMAARRAEGDAFSQLRLPDGAQAAAAGALPSAGRHLLPLSRGVWRPKVPARGRKTGAVRRASGWRPSLPRSGSRRAGGLGWGAAQPRRYGSGRLGARAPMGGPAGPGDFGWGLEHSSRHRRDPRATEAGICSKIAPVSLARSEFERTLGHTRLTANY
jgi:hypothetical protein